MIELRYGIRDLKSSRITPQGAEKTGETNEIVGPVVCRRTQLGLMADSCLGSGAAASSAAAAHTGSPAVLLDVAGSGNQTTQKFAISGDWELAWSYDCSGYALGSRNFIVSVWVTVSNGADGLTFANPETSQLGAKGADVYHFHTGAGTFYLYVDSRCKWHVTVKR